jgi:hypothetical protein
MKAETPRLTISTGAEDPCHARIYTTARRFSIRVEMMMAIS